MIRNYFIVAFRNLWSNKFYSIINIIGLGIGIAAVVWAYQNYRFGFSFDKFHPDTQNIYRGIIQREGSDGWKGVFPMVLPKHAQNDFSSIDETVRILNWGQTVKAEGGEAFGELTHFTDPEFFDFFNFPLVAGTNDISDRSAVLVTEAMAKKYFGEDDPLGKTLIFYADSEHQKPLTVSGVLKNPPLNSTIRFNFLTHIDNHLKADGTSVDDNDWYWLTAAAYFKIKDPEAAERLATDFHKYLPIQHKERPDWKVTNFKLITLAENANVKYINSNNLWERPDDSAVYGTFVIAILIFLSACMNFANTTVARSSRRLKEMGVRKVLGGTRQQLQLQILLECGAVVLLAILVSILINNWWIPTFNEMFEYVDAKTDYLNDYQLLIFLGVIFAATTLLAGLYPAFYTSSFNANTIFRGAVKFGGTNFFSRLLLGVQVAISLVTVVAGIAFAQNAVFQQNYDYGYEREDLINITLYDESNYQALYDAIEQIPSVEALAGTSSLIGFSYLSKTAESEEQKWEVNLITV